MRLLGGKRLISLYYIKVNIFIKEKFKYCCCTLRVIFINKYILYINYLSMYVVYKNS